MVSLLKGLTQDCRDLEAAVASGDATKGRVMSLTKGIAGMGDAAMAAVTKALACHDVGMWRVWSKAPKDPPKGRPPIQVPSR